MELDDAKLPFELHAVIGDVTDEARINDVMERHQPEIIFHAAAHKHVPLMEENPCEAIKNNVRGTRLLAEAAERCGVDRFILISTDKAVNPTSVMGASKRIAELVVQAQATGSGTSFAVVRFGNVLGSNGSVVPRFLEQIKKGGPVTVTHPDMRRFFMLIPEAVQLVLHAASQADSGAIYVLEMGEQVKLLDMARDLIRLSGLVPDEDITIEFTGLRPGEKLFEELVGVGEDVGPSSVEKILRVKNRAKPDARLAPFVEKLERQAQLGATDDVLAAMHALIPEYGASPDAPLEPLPAEDEILSGVVPQPHHAGERACPRCPGGLHRSHARSLPERMRKGLSHRRLFRCDGLRLARLADTAAVRRSRAARVGCRPRSGVARHRHTAGRRRHVRLFAAESELTSPASRDRSARVAVHDRRARSRVGGAVVRRGVSVGVLAAGGRLLRDRDWRPRSSRAAPAPAARSSSRWRVTAAAGLLQVVPLSRDMLARVSPSAPGVIAQLEPAFVMGVRQAHPVSIHPAFTWTGLAFLASFSLLLIGSSRLFSVVGTSAIVKALTVLGVVLALAGIIQKAVYNGRIYGFWTTQMGGDPFGPFVNKNHFAGWMLMALPLTLGLGCAGISRGMRGVRPVWRERFLWLSSPEANELILLLAAAAVMALALVMTMSRSGIGAMALALVLTGWFVVRGHGTASRRAVAGVYLAVLAIVVMGWVGVDSISARFAHADWSEVNGRKGTWSDAWNIATLFPLTGTGLNTYGVATLFYQRFDPNAHYAQAHNDYLQLAAEGGLLLSVPAAAGLFLLVRDIRRRLREDTRVVRLLDQGRRHHRPRRDRAAGDRRVQPPDARQRRAVRGRVRARFAPLACAEDGRETRRWRPALAGP